MRISAGIIAIGALLYFLACTPPPQGNNSSQNQNLSPNQNQGNVHIASKDLKRCDSISDPPGHSHAIKDEIKGKMSSSLKKLLKDQDNPNGTFTLDISKAPDPASYYIAKVTGKISGDDNLKELSDILNDFQDKEQCLRLVYFLPAPGSPAALVDSGFEWSACEYPLHVCPNGECCDTKNENTNTGNMNTNSNGNSNSNANSNSNVRKGNP